MPETLDSLMQEAIDVWANERRRLERLLDALDRCEYGAGYVKARDRQDEHAARRASFSVIDGGRDA